MPERPRPRRRRARTATVGARERLLESALEVFAAQGFGGASTRAIAARAGVNLGLVQYYFGGKERLWRAAVDHAFTEFWTTLAATGTAAPADEGALADLLRAAVRFAAEHPALIQLMNDEGKRDGSRLRWLVDRHGRRLYETVGALGSRTVLAGVAPIHLYYLFVGAIGLLFSQAAECRRLTGVDPTTSPALIEAHVTVLTRLFLRSA